MRRPFWRCARDTKAAFISLWVDGVGKEIERNLERQIDGRGGGGGGGSSHHHAINSETIARMALAMEIPLLQKQKDEELCDRDRDAATANAATAIAADDDIGKHHECCWETPHVWRIDTSGNDVINTLNLLKIKLFEKGWLNSLIPKAAMSATGSADSNLERLRASTDFHSQLDTSLRHAVSEKHKRNRGELASIAVPTKADTLLFFRPIILDGSLQISLGWGTDGAYERLYEWARIAIDK